MAQGILSTMKITAEKAEAPYRRHRAGRSYMRDPSDSLGPSSPHSGSSPPRVVTFGAFRVDLASGVVLKDDELLDLPPRAVGVLRCLLEEPGGGVDPEAPREDEEAHRGWTVALRRAGRNDRPCT